MLPPDEVMFEAAPALTAVFRRGSEAASQNECLQALRDSMLPKLISGEVRLPPVDDIESLSAVSALRNSPSSDG